EPATQWLEAEECAVLSAWATRQLKTKTPSPPSIAEAVRWIARQVAPWPAILERPPPRESLIEHETCQWLKLTGRTIFFLQTGFKTLPRIV
ncbi:MAG: hypothetical protein WAW39_09385, partial [Prosthecobacter sp.]|uniref:hypothetical protein n=1 Tax=Prosthecobacter sp. TaxID=1965333 RepID=UPI003BB085D2